MRNKFPIEFQPTDSHALSWTLKNNLNFDIPIATSVAKRPPWPISWPVYQSKPLWLIGKYVAIFFVKNPGQVDVAKKDYYFPPDRIVKGFKSIAVQMCQNHRIQQEKLRDVCFQTGLSSCVSTLTRCRIYLSMFFSPIWKDSFVQPKKRGLFKRKYKQTTSSCAQTQYRFERD